MFAQSFLGSLDAHCRRGRQSELTGCDRGEEQGGGRVQSQLKKIRYCVTDVGEVRHKTIDTGTDSKHFISHVTCEPLLYSPSEDNTVVNCAREA